MSTARVTNSSKSETTAVDIGLASLSALSRLDEGMAAESVAELILALDVDVEVNLVLPRSVTGGHNIGIEAGPIEPEAEATTIEFVVASMRQISADADELIPTADLSAPMVGPGEVLEIEEDQGETLSSSTMTRLAWAVMAMILVDRSKAWRKELWRRTRFLTHLPAH